MFLQMRSKINHRDWFLATRSTKARSNPNMIVGLEPQLSFVLAAPPFA